MTDSTSPLTSMHEEALKAVRTSQAQAVEMMRQYSKVLSRVFPGRDRVIGSNESLQIILGRQHEAIESSHDFARQVLQLEADFAHKVAAILDRVYAKPTSGSDRATPPPFPTPFPALTVFTAFPMPPDAPTSIRPAFAHLPWSPAEDTEDTVAKAAEAAPGPQDAVSTIASAQRQGSQAARKAAQAQADLAVQMAGTAVEVAQKTSDAGAKMADEVTPAVAAVAPTSRSDTAGAEGRRQSSTTSKSKPPAAKKAAPARSTKPAAAKRSAPADKPATTPAKTAAASPAKPAPADKPAAAKDA